MGNICITRFNKVAIPNSKLQMASGQGSHWLIESQKHFSSMCSLNPTWRLTRLVFPFGKKTARYLQIDFHLVSEYCQNTGTRDVGLSDSMAQSMK